MPKSTKTRIVMLELPDMNARDYRAPMTLRLLLAMALADGADGEQFLDAPLQFRISDGNGNSDWGNVHNDWPPRVSANKTTGEAARIYLQLYTTEKRLVRAAGRG